MKKFLLIKKYPVKKTSVKVLSILGNNLKVEQVVRKLDHKHKTILLKRKSYLVRKKKDSVVTEGSIINIIQSRRYSTTISRKQL